MQALGMIETKGLLAAIESADVMLKAAEVTLLDRTFVRGGLVTITVTGDVAAVKASVEAAAAAVERLGPGLLLSRHVIPRPHPELEHAGIISGPGGDAPAGAGPAEPSQTIRSREELELLMEQQGAEKTLALLGSCKVVELRYIAREYADFGIQGRDVSKANKTSLLEAFHNYYKQVK